MTKRRHVAVAAVAAALIAAMAEPTVKAADDFYTFANADWLRTTRLPAGATRVDTVTTLRARNAARVRALIEDAVRTRGPGPDLRKLADFHTTLLDRPAIEAAGVAPLAGDLAAIAAIGDRRTLAAWLGRTTRLDDGSNQDTQSLWGVFVHQDFHDPDHYAAHLVQGGLGLGDRQAYLDTGEAAEARRLTYRAHVAAVLRLAGLDQSEARAGRVLDLETAIARTHASRAETDDVFKTDNNWRRADFAARAPGLDWNAYLAAAGLDRARRFVVWQPGALIGSTRLVAEAPLESWRDYLAYHLVDHYAAVLPRAIRGDADAPDPSAATQAVFGDAIGRLYVARWFPPRAKAAAEAMAANLRRAFRARLATLGWMDRATRARALAKLDALDLGLGYPDRWTDYAALQIVPGDAVGNQRRADAFAYARSIARLDRPVDPGEWTPQLHAQSVGAILMLSPNSMQFAAGLLQPPFFDPDGDSAANYGSAGAGMAHEIAHSFDEVGNIYDARGRLGRWWSAADGARFAAGMAGLAAQLDGCHAALGLAVDGRRVARESGADIVGLLVALDAYHLSRRGIPDVPRGGLSGDRRFFVAFAQRWRRRQADAALRAQVAGDDHAPPSCRSNLVRNVDAWADAFAIRPGDALYLAPEARFRLWSGAIPPRRVHGR